MDIGSIAAVLSSMKTATDIAAILTGMKTDAAVQSKAIELTTALLQVQQQLMATQLEQMELIGKVAELKAKLAEVTAESAQRDSYERHQFVTGQFAYTLKGESSDDKPRYYLCSRCHENDKKQVTLHVNGGCLFCPECKNAIRSEPAKPIKVRPTRRSTFDTF